MDLNVLVLSGRLGKDPEMRYTSTEKAVCNFPLAISLSKENTLWIDVTAWGRQAENVNQYLSKGSHVAINGYLSQDAWEDDEGRRRVKIRAVANNVQFLDSPKQKSESSKAKGPSSKKEDVDELLDGAEDLGEYDFPL
jgi:single-strand DNA-binding protein